MSNIDSVHDFNILVAEFDPVADLIVFPRPKDIRRHDCIKMVWRLLEHGRVHLTSHKDAVKPRFETCLVN